MDDSRPPATRPVRDVVDYELLFECVHCGLCLEACPTYIVRRAEMDSPRGRIYLMKSLAEGALELDSDLVRHLDLCLGCRGCETACPSGVHYGRLVERARAFVENNARRNLPDRIRRRIALALLPYPRRMGAVLAPFRIAERVGLRSTVEQMVPGAMREWLELIPPLVGSGADGARVVSGGETADAPVVAMHQGCVARVLASEQNLNSARLLAAAGYNVRLLDDAPCCGALDLHAGNRKRALEFARANVRAIKRSGASAVVSAAAGCSATMAEYGELLKDDPELAADAQEVGGRVKDLSTLLLERRPKFRELQCTVTYHDACHLAHGLGVREAPRRLLASIAGVELIDLQESEVCCGSAGIYNLTEPVMARALAERKAGNIVRTGADYVVMANPGCELQIAAAMRRRGAQTRVLHLADFLALAL